MVLRICILFIGSWLLVFRDRFGLNARGLCDLSVFLKCFHEILIPFPDLHQSRGSSSSQSHKDDHKDDDETGTRHSNSQLDVDEMHIHDDYLNFSNLDPLSNCSEKLKYFSSHCILPNTSPLLHHTNGVVLSRIGAQERRQFGETFFKLSATEHSLTRNRRDCSESHRKNHCLQQESYPDEFYARAF